MLDKNSQEVEQMNTVEVKTNVEGLDELKELLEVATQQTVSLQETLDKISKSKIKIEVKSGIFKTNE
jgi:hypothetical protein